MKRFVLGALKSVPTAQPATAISAAIFSAAHSSRTGISPSARRFHSRRISGWNSAPSSSISGTTPNFCKSSFVDVSGPNFGAITTMAGTPRVIQFMLRYGL